MCMYIVFLHTGGVGSIGKVVSIKNWKSETVVSMYNHVFCAYHHCDYQALALSIIYMQSLLRGERELSTSVHVTTMCSCAILFLYCAWTTGILLGPGLALIETASHLKHIRSTCTRILYHNIIIYTMQKKQLLNQELSTLLSMLLSVKAPQTPEKDLLKLAWQV